MVNPWLAMEAGADPAERIRTVRRAHEAFLSDGTVAPPVRQVVADSWRRSARARAAPDGVAPVELDEAALLGYREAHPLARAMPVIRELLGSIAQDGAHLLAVCDPQGRLLWVEGHRGVLRRAERMNFVVGARWDERHAGTNAPGTALAADHAVQIFATEHYNRRVQPWTCAAAPLHDTRTGRLLGAVDITGGDHLASPHSLALVQATARAAEAHLAAPPTRPGAFLTALGRDEALLVRDGERLRLGRRHSEIMVLLAHHPAGLTGDQLAVLLYGEREVRPVTLRAELSRLRPLVGPLLRSRPYRLTTPLETDLASVEQDLTQHHLSSAVDSYRGPLLPSSEAPGIRRLRTALEDRMRRALLAAGDPDQLRAWARTPWGEHDLEVHEALVAALPERSPARQAPAAAAVRLRAEFRLGARPEAFGASHDHGATFAQPPPP
ncbi:GAF domain-containing protein (plasmid) [Streptomyces sp. BHT-5-2]|uniref:helix-turn-helix domain-containing protein n=1 Tax=Streptomyces sp. BHT-5-2 TaxID=2866715 RepID=UPI001C8DAA61|nr:helix-turn-helix domain-containing protein [Streptomyces sp. BHT-5-2]QZL07388.1 GAF domain-containing protein [Streptomyces sp. BHT-5-2]